MQLILTRHGQSTSNALKIHQGKDDPLSDLGKKQAGLVAKRLSKFPIERIMVSDHIRAKETAEIINTRLKKTLEELPLLGEIRKPSVIVGKHHNHPEAKKIRQLLETNYHQPGWRHSDEENFEDMKARVIQFLEIVEQSEYQSVLAVTHGMFIRFALSMMLHGKELNSRTFRTVEATIPNENTNISICEFQAGNWFINTMCDCSHLELLELSGT